MIPADTNRNIQEEYNILYNELQLYNPDLLDKPRILAISKCDLIDDELEKMLRATLPVSYTHLRAHETVLDLVCRLLLETKKTHNKRTNVNSR